MQCLISVHTHQFEPYELTLMAGSEKVKVAEVVREKHTESITKSENIR